MSDSPDEPTEPPERDFDESTVVERLDEAVAEAIEVLPDFPGFESRSMSTQTCSHNGEVDEDYIRYEMTYQFSAEDSESELVHQTYVEVLRQAWTEAGYDIHRDETRGSDDPHYIIEAIRPDGINYWVRAANYTNITVQSGCVRRSSETPACTTPLGGVTRENDLARISGTCAGTETVYPDDTESADAMAPFEGGQADFTPFTGPGRRDESFGHPVSYEGQL